MRDVLGSGFTQLQGLSLMSLNLFRVPGLFLQLFGDHSVISWGLLSLDDAALWQGLSGAGEMPRSPAV